MGVGEVQRSCGTDPKAMRLVRKPRLRMCDARQVNRYEINVKRNDHALNDKRD